MPLHQGTKIPAGYATVAEDDGVNYRDIADTLTELGFKMNHSSARNHVIRVMRQFVVALAEEWGMELPSEAEIDRIAKDPSFQHGISDVLHVAEAERRTDRV